jgi:hypothetical protein
MGKKSGQLVTKYLENISINAIEKYKDIIKESIRGENGIYALYDGDELVYVGLATDLHKRLDHHLSDRHQGEWDSFSVYITKTRHLRELESLLMRVAYPKNNRQKGKFRSANNLRDDFEDAIDNYFEEEKSTFFGKRGIKKEHKKKNKFFKERKFDMIVVPAKRSGFEKVFLGENCWHEIRLNENKIDKLKYIAAYQKAPISAITYLAKIKSIKKYKNTGKYVVYFKGKPRKLRKPIKAKHLTMQSLIYGNRRAMRKAKTIEDVMK